jgi:hypothetical protein
MGLWDSMGISDHTLLSSIGTNSHTQIDSDIATSVAHIASVNEHIDWTQDQGATDIHANNVPAGGGGAWTVISTTDVSGLSNTDFTLSSAYTIHILEYKGLASQTAGATLRAIVGPGGSPTGLAGYYTQGYEVLATVFTGKEDFPAISWMNLSFIGLPNNVECSGRITIRNANVTGKTAFVTNDMYMPRFNTTPNIIQTISNFDTDNAAGHNVDIIRLSLSTNVFNRGTVKHYGIT